MAVSTERYSRLPKTPRPARRMPDAGGAIPPALMRPGPRSAAEPCPPATGGGGHEACTRSSVAPCRLPPARSGANGNGLGAPAAATRRVSPSRAGPTHLNDEGPSWPLPQEAATGAWTTTPPRYTPDIRENVTGSRGAPLSDVTSSFRRNRQAPYRATTSHRSHQRPPTAQSCARGGASRSRPSLSTPPALAAPCEDWRAPLTRSGCAPL